MAKSKVKRFRGDAVPATGSGNPIIDEARKRFDRCMEWESDFRASFLDDIRFANGDSDNNYQWPNEIAAQRAGGGKPCLTMNIVRQHNLQIVNQAKQNKQSIKIIGTGNGATQESANVLRDVVRRIEYQSRAQSAYSTAQEFQVAGGVGWWRLACDYFDNDSFDQEIFIRPVNDPLSVLIDCDCEQKDCSDASYAFVFDSVPKEEFYEAYPKLDGMDGMEPLGLGSVDEGFHSDDEIRVCEYFRVVYKESKLLSILHMGERKSVRQDLLHPTILKAVIDDPLTKVRTVQDREVEWKLIVGEKIVDQTIWPGKYIPLIRVLGEKSTIGGKLDIKGHTRTMKSAQRMYNFNASAQVEHVALQGKTPWIVPLDAIEELENIWETANTINHAYLPYKHKNLEAGDDQPIPPPTRTDPPNSSPAYQTGMETALNQMMSTSGQYQNQLGMMGNERTGAAIGKRQAQSDTAVFHFEDNYEEALIYTGRQLIDLIPKIYDTKRVMQIVADDGLDYTLEIDPAAKQALATQSDHTSRVIRQIFNPMVGKYDVAASVGPAMGSKMEETSEALQLIVTQNPQIGAVIGDLLVGSIDFPMAQEAAQRLKRMVPPQALGKGPSQTEQQLTQQVQMLSKQIEDLLNKGAKDQLKLVGKDEKRDIEVYRSETDRMKALAAALPQDAQGLSDLVHQLVQESIGTHISAIAQANEPQLEADSGEELPDEGEPNISQEDAEHAAANTPPLPGAKRASDGHWYASDPTRQGKYMRIEMKTPPLPGARQAPDRHWYVPDNNRAGKFMRVN